MIKLPDFARENGISERQVQRILRQYESELIGLYERKGRGGTWLTEEACAFIRSKMSATPVAVADTAARDELNRLRSQNEQLQQQLIAVQQQYIAYVEQTTPQLMAAAEQRAALEARNAELDAERQRPLTFGEFWRRRKGKKNG